MKRGSILLAIVFTITIPALIAWPALRIAGSWTAGQESVRASYGSLRRLAISAINQPSALATPRWSESALKNWMEDDRLLALVISEPSGTVLYALPEASPYYLEPSPDVKGPGFLHPDNTVARFSGSISSNLVLDALYVTLRQEEVYRPLKDATIGLLVLLILTAAWLLAATAVHKTEDETSSAARAEPSREDISGIPEYRAEPAVKTEVPAYTGPDMSAEQTDFPKMIELSSPPTTIAFPAMSAPASSDSQAEQVHQDPIGEDLSPATDSRAAEPGLLHGPRGLYDPETGLGWESYLRERLGAELRRSAAFEQDLSLLVASLDSASGRTDPNYAVFAKTSRSFFSFNDLAFLYGSKGLAVIIPNTDIDQAMRLTEELLKKLVLLIQDRSDPMSYLNLFMGLSSRSGRLVEADRLLSEAMAAHRKAREERDTHIMAFRPDPEKFRAYLASK